jgi:hypothetical protein
MSNKIRTMNLTTSIAAMAKKVKATTKNRTVPAMPIIIRPLSAFAPLPNVFEKPSTEKKLVRPSDCIKGAERPLKATVGPVPPDVASLD